MFYTLDKGSIQDSIQLLLKLENKDSLFVVKRDTFGTHSKEDKIKVTKNKSKKKLSLIANTVIIKKPKPLQEL